MRDYAHRLRELTQGLLGAQPPRNVRGEPFQWHSITSTQRPFPHSQHPPAQGAQRTSCMLIARTISTNFFHPERSVCLRYNKQVASVPVPEATVNKDDGLIFRKDKIWRSRQMPLVQTVPQSKREEGFTQHHLWFGVAAFDLGHAPLPLLRRQYIHSYFSL